MKIFYSTLGIDNAIKEQERDNIKANQKVNNMLNSTKTWQEDFRLKLYNVYATVFQLSKYDNQQLKEKADVMVQFVSDLRKKDEEELIKMLEEFETYAYIPEFKKAIQDYYEN